MLNDKERQDILNTFIKDLMAKPFNPTELKDKIKLELVGIYKDNQFRHSYSQIFLMIQECKDNSEGMGYLLGNIETLTELIDEENFGVFKKHLFKLTDHLMLEISRINFYSTKGYQEETLRQIKEAKSNYSEAKEQFKTSQKSMRKSIKDIGALKSEIITVLSIFAAIMLGSIGGVSFVGNVMSSLNNTSIYRILLMTNVAGFIVFNLVFSLLYIASRMLQRNIYSKCKTENGENDCDCGKCKDNCWGINRVRKRLPYVFWINFIILLMIGLTVLDWKYRWIGYKFLQ